MTSTVTMYILIGFYLLIVAQALWERNWWRMCYFVGAIIISVSVLAMTSSDVKPEVGHGAGRDYTYPYAGE